MSRLQGGAPRQKKRDGSLSRRRPWSNPAQTRLAADLGQRQEVGAGERLRDLLVDLVRVLALERGARVEQDLARVVAQGLRRRIQVEHVQVRLSGRHTSHFGNVQAVAERL